MAGYIMGRLHPDEALYVLEYARQLTFLVARIWLIIYLLTLALAVLLQSFIPLILIGGPRIYGAWHFNLTGYLQHGGMPDNVNNYRLNARTALMNPFSRFVYLNMNYNIEHHMFPLVPY